MRFQLNSCENARIKIKHAYFNDLMFVKSLESILKLNLLPGGLTLRKLAHAIYRDFFSAVKTEIFS